MELVWQTNAWEDYLYWQQQDKKILARINELIKDTTRSPLKGIGKPEPLKGDLSGCWSRRFTDETPQTNTSILGQASALVPIVK